MTCDRRRDFTAWPAEERRHRRAWGCGLPWLRRLGQCSVPASSDEARSCTSRRRIQTITFGAARGQELRRSRLQRQRGGVLRLGGLLQCERELHTRRRDRASDGRRFVHGDRCAAGRRELQPRAGCFADVRDREGRPDDHLRPARGQEYGDPDFSVSAAASSGLAVSFTASGNCTVGGATVHLTGAGSCTVTASQPGDANYNPAPGVSRTFSIVPAPCRVPKVVGKRVDVRQADDRKEALPHRQGGLRLLAQAQEGHRHLPEPPAWTGAAGPLEDQPHRQSRPQALTTSNALLSGAG